MTTLEDLRILDLSEGIAGAYCTKLFADQGADVIVIEPPGGNALRHADIGRDLGTSKRAITLDLRTETGRRLFRRMVEQANVVVETFAPGALEALGLGYGELGGIKRRIVLVSIAPHGQTGVSAPPTVETELLAGLNAFAASAIAAHNADAYEVPQHIDISIAECHAVAAAAAPGGVPSLSAEAALFRMSEVARSVGPAPLLGEHNVEFFSEELGLKPRDLVLLRAAGVI